MRGTQHTETMQTITTANSDHIFRAWKTHAKQLAEKFLPLVNRSDAWITSGTDGRRWTDKRKSDSPSMLELLTAHFRGEHSISLHDIRHTDRSCAWVANELDLHGISKPDAATLNECHARDLSDFTRSNGLHSIVSDSNGAGGFHCLTILPQRIPDTEATDLALSLIHI